MKITIFLVLVFATDVAGAQNALSRQQWDAVEGLYQFFSGVPPRRSIFCRILIRFRRDELWRVVHVTMGNGTEWDRSDGVMVPLSDTFFYMPDYFQTYWKVAKPSILR
jgi:hypothetical protein